MTDAAIAWPPRVPRALSRWRLTHGSAYASYLARIRKVKDAPWPVGSHWGPLALLGAGLGALVGSLAVGPLVPRFSSHTFTARATCRRRAHH